MAAAQLAKILHGKIWRFFGGIKPAELKSTSAAPIEELPIPTLITLPLERHLGPGSEILVKVGDKVKAGQVLTIPGGKRNVPLHASTSGTIVAINEQVLPHPSGFTGRCITIKSDGLDEHMPPSPIENWQEKSATELLERIRFFGIEGLGGAQFQTAAKLSSAIADGRACNIFIVNGAECEPVATCDDRLMQEKAADIMQGVAIIKHILQPKVVIIAIEDNKPQAIAAMQKAAGNEALVRVIPTLYPSGAARNLIKIVTGIEIPYAAHTSDCGIVVDNVETVFAVKQAIIDGLPLIKRVVTVAGGSLKQQGNALVRLGTSVRFVLNHYHLNPERRQRIILGGPLMGFTLPTIDVPLTKSATCVFAPTSKEVPPEDEPVNCIRCGRCARVCPSRLVPYQMYAYSKAGDHEKAAKCGIADCTECGCCAYVCPSRIRLTGQFRKEKAIQYLLKENAWRNEKARERMRIHQEREQEAARLREEKKRAALARIKAQQTLQAGKGASATATVAGAADPELAKKRAAALAAAQARRAAMTQGKVAATGVAAAPTPDPELAQRRAAALAAAKARREAKAQAQAQAVASTTEQAVTPNAPAPMAALNLPRNLRRGDSPKQASIISAPWPEPQVNARTPNKVENPPTRKIEVSKARYHSILAPGSNDNSVHKLPQNLSKTRNK